MASKFAKTFSVPDGFPELLRDLTREVLREYPRAHEEQPKDAEWWILDFAARYFSSRVAMAGASADGTSLTDLEAKIVAIFQEADKDSNGVLDHKEFRTVVRAFSSQLGLPMKDVRRLMSEADENEDGLIDYKEFVPLAVEIIETIYSKRRFEDEMAMRQADAVAETEDFLHGMSRERLESTLRDMFNRADADGSGRLSRSEFQAALRSSGIGLTRQEINVLMAEVDENADGEIDYEEFLPICFNILVEMTAKLLEEKRIPQHELELKDFFSTLFAEADTAGGGRLIPTQIRAALTGADIGLSVVQLTSLMVEAKTDEDGLVDCEEFAGTAAGIVARIMEVQASSDRAAEIAAAQESGELSLVAGMDRATFAEALNHAVGHLDPENSGFAGVEEVSLALTDMGLSDAEVQILLELGNDARHADEVDLNKIGRFGFDAISAVALQQILGPADEDAGAAVAADG